MFGRLGHFVANHARAVLVVTVLVMIGAGALGFTAFSKLQSEGFTDPAAESSKAQELLDREFGGEAGVVFLLEPTAGTVDDPAVRQAGVRLTERLAAEDTLTDAVSYFNTQAPAMRSEDGRQAIAVAKLADGVDAETAIAELRDSYAEGTEPFELTVGGGSAVGLDINEQVGADLALAESIAVPVILVLLVLVFGSVVAALLPLAVGAIAILGTFAELSVLASLTDVSVFSIQMTTALGLGLAIDYALLMVYRFREELAGGADVQDAVVTTVRTAGRTIVFSAATVAVALAALLVFPLYFLRSFAYAGVGVVVVAMLGAIVVLPALLTVLGPRVNAGRLPWAKRSPSSLSTFWGRTAGAVLRRPALLAAPVILLLVLLATPLLRVEFGTPDDRVLPTSTDTRVVGDALRNDFPADDNGAVQIVTDGAVDPTAVANYASTVSELPGVDVVRSSAGTFVDGQSRGATGSLPPDHPLADAAMATERAQRLTVTTEFDPRSADGQELASTIRELPGPSGADTLVGGQSAVLADSKAAIGERLPLALALIAITTFVLLFLFTGSLLQPLRALVFNVLGLSAILGLMVLIFQDGWLSSLLNFTPMPLDTSMLVLMFCIVFGLSMDYEVFVLSRVKEAHDQGAGPRDAVTVGLSRTGRLISMAAVLLSVSLLAFGTSGVSFIQMFGIGAGLAVLVDATLIRGVLLPAGMRLLGAAAWWAPRPLRRLHDRVGLREGPPETPDPERSLVNV